MGLVGKVGAGLAAMPLVFAAVGNGSSFGGALTSWQKGEPLPAIIREFAQVLTIQYVGKNLDGSDAPRPAAFSGWTWLGYGAALMLGDALAGKVARRLGVRAPRLPLIGRTISG